MRSLTRLPGKGGPLRHGYTPAPTGPLHLGRIGDRPGYDRLHSPAHWLGGGHYHRFEVKEEMKKGMVGLWGLEPSISSFSAGLTA